jgi:hypothetical protein
MTDWRGSVERVVVAGSVAAQPLNGYEIVGPVSVADLAIVAALAIVASKQILSDDGWMAAGVRPVVILMIALAGWLALVGDGWKLTQFGAFLLIIGLVGAYARTIEDVETIMWGVLAGAILASVLTLFSILIAPEFGGRVAGSRGIGPLPELPRTIGVPIGSFGSWATYVLAPLGFAVARWYQTRTRWLLVPVGVILSAVILNQTRATYLALAVLTTVVVIGLYGRRLWNVGWRNAGASVFVLGGGGIAATVVGWRLYAVNPTNALRRFRQFERALVLIADNPLVGMTPPIIQHFPVTNNIPHNVVLLVGVVGGVPAVTILLTTFVIAAAGLWYGYTRGSERVRTLSLGVAAGWAATLTSLSLAPGFTRAFWLLVGVGGVLLLRTGDRLDPTPWFETALSNSRIVSGLRELHGGTLARILTADATGEREQLRVAWRESSTRECVRRVRSAVASAAMTQVLFGK